MCGFKSSFITEPLCDLGLTLWSSFLYLSRWEVVVIPTSRLVGLVNERFLTRFLTWLAVGTPKQQPVVRRSRVAERWSRTQTAQRSVPGRRQQGAGSPLKPTWGANLKAPLIEDHRRPPYFHNCLVSSGLFLRSRSVGLERFSIAQR